MKPTKMYNQKKNLKPILGIDLGGTNVRCGRLVGNELEEIRAIGVSAGAAADVVLNEVFGLIEQLLPAGPIEAIGVGVPSVVDAEEGVVYDVQNIPSWKEVRLKAILEDRYKVPVFINNDANCFALGEKCFGLGTGVESMVGLSIGTGLGAGIIIHNRLYSGTNCGAGEFGMINYLDRCFEYYASGQFFLNVYGISGELVYERAKAGNSEALEMYEVLGGHLGNAIKAMMYAYDPTLIVLGGSVSAALPYFESTMWQQLRDFAYPKSVEKLDIKLSTLKHAGVFGAAALCLA